MTVGRRAGELKVAKGLTKGLLAGVSEAAVPQLCGRDAGEGASARDGRSRAQGVQVAGRVTPKDHQAGADILDRKPKGVKFN